MHGHDTKAFLLWLNPLPHGVPATISLTAGGLLRPPEEGDISREKTLLMTAGLIRPPPVRREQFQPPVPLSLSIEWTGHWVHLLEVFLDPHGKEREQQIGVGGEIG